MVQFAQLKAVLLDGLLEALREGAAYIASIKRTARGDVPVSGLSFELYPWHEYIALSLRGSITSRDKEGWYNPAEWRHFEFVSSQSCRSKAFRHAAQTITELYNSWDEKKRAEAAHIIFLAAAEALLDERVASVLQQFQLDARVVGDELESLRGGVEYMVFNSDETISANYCEIVLAHRVTARLLGGET